MSEQKEPLRVVISGAAGQIGYALIPLVSSGLMFGPNQPVILQLLDIEPAMKALKGVAMEIEDGAYPLVKGIITTSNYDEAFAGAQWIILIGGFPRGPGMTRGDLLLKNAPIYIETAKSLDRVAADDARILVVANPANTNALILSNNMSKEKIPKENITALTRLDMNRASSMIARKLGQPVDAIKNVTIFGNHSASQFPYAGRATGLNGESVTQAIADKEFLDGDFIKLVQQRGAEVINARGVSSAMSAANAIKDHMHDWYFGTKPGEVVSMAVNSSGNPSVRDKPSDKGNPYGVAEGLIYSFPVSIENQQWKIKGGYPISPFQQEKLNATEKELLTERETVMNAPKL